MKKHLRLFILAVVMISLILSAGCTKPADKPGETETPGEAKVEAKYKVGVSLMNREQSFYKDLEAAMQKTAQEKGVALEIRDAQFDSSKQLNGTETLLIGDLDAIIICPVDSKAVGSAVKAANQKNVPVFTVDIKAEKGDVVSHIASDNPQGGKKAAEYMAKILDGKGNIVILNSPEVTSVQERVRGFKEEVAKHPEMKILEDIDGGAKKGSAMKAMENLLQANQNIDGVFAINDETALGALRAIEVNKRENIIIVGYDATPEAQKEILSGGPLKADVVQDPGKMGEVAIETVVKHFEGKEVPAQIPIPITIMDKESLEKAKAEVTEEHKGEDDKDTPPATDNKKEEKPEETEKTPQPE
ncbi:MAG: substrate-binding domain-containing protein [Vulcanimicrobiota bacterium]